MTADPCARIHLVIPMSGEGARFKKAGYQTLKPLIDVDGRPILAHVLDGFPGVRKITFICNSVHLETTELPRVLRELAPAARIRAIAPHKRGPVHALQQVYDLIDDDEPVVVNYCDFAWEWDFADFAARVQGEGVDGCVLAYIGFHPHNLGPSLYAFMRARGDRVEEIREKHHFTPNKLDEYASSGTYYFRTGALLKRCCDLTVARDIAINGEYYVSSVFQTMIEDGRRVSVYPLRRFCQWGTPEDLEDYLSWSRVFRRKSEPAAARATGAGLTAIMLAAGSGKRFADEGWAIPKAFIPVSGRPMVEQAARSLPAAERLILAFQRRHLDQNAVEIERLRLRLPHAELFVVPELTAGQAITASLAARELPPDAPVVVGSCDTALLLDQRQWRELRDDLGTDAVVFSFRNYLPAEWRPQAYGWIETDGDVVRRVSTKKPISATPRRDHAVTGAFYYRRAQLLLDGVNALVAQKRTINNEYYLDEMTNVLVESGRRVRALEVDRHVTWGTPDELRTFQYWQQHFHLAKHHPYRLELDEDFPWVEARRAR